MISEAIETAKEIAAVIIIATAFLLIAIFASVLANAGEYDANGNATVFLAHPSECPPTRFCGCGASVRIFGHSVRSLWPAAAWFDGRFPRAEPSSGMVAGNNRHVFVLEDHIGGLDWLVTDYNSGGHRSRRHVRSIAGLKVVNPHGSRTASYVRD